MRRSSVVTTIAFGVTVAASGAEARLDLYVDKSRQQLSVIQDGALLYVWPVSTGMDRHSTPNGVYMPERLERNWSSKAYYNSPMPYAIFFHNGYAIHGSYDISKLGGPASHGCVRLHPREAALLFSMVQQEGPDQTIIYVGGDTRRLPPAYRPDFEEPSDPPPRPFGRRGEGMARGDYPQGPAAPPRNGRTYVDDAYAPPAGAQAAPNYRNTPPNRSAGRGGAYAPGPGASPYGGPYYEPDPYAGGDPRGYRAAPYGDYADRYAEGQDDPSYDPRVSPDYDAGPYSSGRRASRSPRVPAEYDSNPYAGDGSAGDNGMRGPASPYYYPQDRSYSPDGRDGWRGANLRGAKTPPKTPPYETADRRADAPERRYEQLPVRGDRPANRPALNPAWRPAGEGQYAPPPGAMRPAEPIKTKPAGRFAEEPPARRVTMGEPARAPMAHVPLPPIAPPPPPPMPATSLPAVPPLPTPAVRVAPPPERFQTPAPPDAGYGYKVLPRSYWAGASWRWRMKRDEEGFPHDDEEVR